MAAASIALLAPRPTPSLSAPSAGGTVALSFAPVVHVTATVGTTDNLEARIQLAVRAMLPEVERRIRDIAQRRERGDFKS